MGKKSRDKGKGFELEARKVGLEFFPEMERDLDQVRKSSGRDFTGTQPLCIQAKRNANNTRAKINTGYIEAQQAADEEYPVPIVVFRDDNTTPYKDIMCMMRWSDLIEWVCRMEDGEL
jgi:hypothetical protein